MSTALAKTDSNAGALESVLINGDLANLNEGQRVSYYHQVCDSLGLNPLTKPFEYLKLNGKLLLYARKDCTEQLRRLNGVSITIAAREEVAGCYVVTARASDKSGRCDESIGAVPIEGLKGESRANALMKAETKAKRRVTLSISGLGMLDETEVDSIPGAQRTFNGRAAAPTESTPAPRPPVTITPEQAKHYGMTESTPAPKGVTAASAAAPKTRPTPPATASTGPASTTIEPPHNPVTGEVIDAEVEATITAEAADELRGVLLGDCKMAKPHAVAWLAKYFGCKSVLELTATQGQAAIELARAKVLGDEEYERTHERLLAAGTVKA